MGGACTRPASATTSAESASPHWSSPEGLPSTSQPVALQRLALDAVLSSEDEDGDRVSTLPVLRRKPRLRPPPENRRRRQQPEVVKDLDWSQSGDSASTLTREQAQVLRGHIARQTSVMPDSPSSARAQPASLRSPSLASIFPSAVISPRPIRLDGAFNAVSTAG